ncbi:MAG TPA: S53 family peptidase [Verrucomicrobiae bacterium]|nr:S53 family peptidase [Verrucomicrobiae bacterium]
MSKRLAVLFAAGALAAGCGGRSGTPLVPGIAGTSSRLAAAPLPVGVPRQRLGEVRFDVVLPLRNEGELNRFIAQSSEPDSPQYGQRLTRAQFLARYAPSQADLAAIASDLRSRGFNVSIMDQAVAAGGTRAQVSAYFGRSGRALPEALARRRAGVIGLQAMPPVHTFSRLVPVPAGMRPHNAFSPLGPYFPVDLKQAYQFPSYLDATGKGVKIGIVIDSPIHPSDLKYFFTTRLHIAPAPSVTVVNVGGGAGFGNDTGEATLDVEQAGAIAPGAKIVVFNVKSLDATAIYDGYQAAIDTKGLTLVNSSFGGCEQGAGSLLVSLDSLYKEGIAVNGTTFVAASGDHGADQCGANNNAVGVVWPADSPYVLAVGGTNLVTGHVASSNDSTYAHEYAYDDVKPDSGGNVWGSGGGYSTQYARPSWQDGFVSKNARGLPDLALHMGGMLFSNFGTLGNYGSGTCQAQKCSPYGSSDLEYENGELYLAAGTSASSPDIVGMIALWTQLRHKPFGDIHSVIYKAAAKGMFRRGIAGNNGFPTTSGSWDPVLGVGTPVAAYKLLGAKAAAGTPGSSSNP